MLAIDSKVTETPSIVAVTLETVPVSVALFDELR